MQPLGTKVYLLKRYSPSDSFCTFFLRVRVKQDVNSAETVERVCLDIQLSQTSWLAKKKK